MVILAFMVVGLLVSSQESEKKYPACIKLKRVNYMRAKSWAFNLEVPENSTLKKVIV